MSYIRTNLQDLEIIKLEEARIRRIVNEILDDKKWNAVNKTSTKNTRWYGKKKIAKRNKIVFWNEKDSKHLMDNYWTTYNQPNVSTHKRRSHNNKLAKLLDRTMDSLSYRFSYYSNNTKAEMQRVKRTHNRVVKTVTYNKAFWNEADRNILFNEWLTRENAPSWQDKEIHLSNVSLATALNREFKVCYKHYKYLHKLLELGLYKPIEIKKEHTFDVMFKATEKKQIPPIINEQNFENPNIEDLIGNTFMNKTTDSTIDEMKQEFDNKEVIPQSNEEHKD